MSNVTNIETRRVPFLQQKYPPANLTKSDILSRRFIRVTFGADELARYEILFLYRLMKKNYGFPHMTELTDRSSSDLSQKYFLQKTEGGFQIILDQEFQELSAEEKDKIINQIGDGLVSQALDWKYYVKTKSGYILEVGTTDYHNKMRIGFLIPQDSSNPESNILKEAELFVSDLLEETKRLDGQLLHIQRDFDKYYDKFPQYLTINVYLDNYRSAELMIEQATENEDNIRDNASIYDARTKEWDIPENREFTDKYMWASGMHYQACCIYLFMALEGFVNLIYHAFLIEEFRDRDFNFEHNFDIEKKIRLIPVLCKGFDNKYLDPSSEIITSFKSIRKYRNRIFHSKIEDSLIKVLYVEDGFFYSCNLAKERPTGFPSLKIDLTMENVMEVKLVVDQIITHIIGTAKMDIQNKISKYIMKQPLVPFWRNEKGEIGLGFF